MHTVQKIPTHVARPRDTTTLILGLIGLLASPALFVAWLMGGFDNPDPPQPVLIAQLLFLVGWICSIVALIRITAAGQGRARYLLWVQVAGIAFAATQELQDLFPSGAGRISGLYQLADAAWPLSVLFMLVSGTAVARAGVLHGSARFAVLVCGFVLPVALAAAALLGRGALGAAFAFLTMCAWGFLATVVINTAHSSNTHARVAAQAALVR